MAFDLARKYALYYLKAKTKHGVHSPFVFDLVTKVLEDPVKYPDYKTVENLRLSLLNNRLVTEVEDFGAGRKQAGTYQKRVSEIVAKTAKPARWGKLLYRLCRHYHAINIIELGTSLGVSSAYQALGALQSSPSIRFTTIEGSKNLADMAAINLGNLGFSEPQVTVVPGEFDKVLPSVLESYSSIDFAFVDGNHRKEPTLNYFELLLPKAHNDTVFVFDDIHWSDEMTEAWEQLKLHPQVTVTIDLFYLGLVFIRQEQVKENFVLRF